jgi:oligopeptide/dipeptide ABC transporter ATP-binding protein
MALACEPKLLIADEPTTALDVTVQRQILELILTLRDQTGTAVILITHDVGVVSEVCDRVAVMYAGRVVEVGATEAVFMQPTHPYTVGLLASTIGLDGSRHQPLGAIPGLPPQLIGLPPGCPFAARCAYALEKCREQTPPLERRNADQESACWHPRNVIS